MSSLPSVKQGLIQVEETQFKAAVSEYTQQRLGKNINFLLSTICLERQFTMNRSVKAFLNSTAVDGVFVFPYAASITDIIAYAKSMGTSGFHEFDIKISTAWNGSSFGAWTSILTTTPKINYNAPTMTTVRIGDSITNCTAAVMSSNPYNVNAGDRIRLDVLNVQGGVPLDAAVTIKFIPR